MTKEMICPANWEEAHKWQDYVNLERGEGEEPRWKWDCNFKLDFDGPLVHVSSRFYPPHKNVLDRWEGTTTLYLKDTKICSREFTADTLDELKDLVEDYVENTLVRCLSSVLTTENGFY